MIPVSFMFYVFAYWCISMGTFLYIKGTTGDEVNTFVAIVISFLWPLTLSFALAVVISEHFANRGAK